MKKWLMGVDEAGRGPLAGPVAVGVVMVAAHFDIKKHFPDARDSKVLSEKKREEIYKRMQELQKAALIQYVVRFASAKTIDTVGITKATHRSIYSGVRALAPKPQGVRVVLDGLLHAPEGYEQETIIRGDATEPIISLASIAAKVERDRLMKGLAKKYPEYGLEVHKGYGTLRHRQAIKKLGLSAVHRATFCENLI